MVKIKTEPDPCPRSVHEHSLKEEEEAFEDLLDDFIVDQTDDEDEEEDEDQDYDPHRDKKQQQQVKEEILFDCEQCRARWVKKR